MDDALNPRKAPRILARAGQSGAEVFPFHSDYDHPAIFWLTNGWNDLRYNVAVGAGTCGACYWLPPSVNSGPSVYETWESYASMQTNGRGGLAPIENFVGNSCSTAMNSIETVGETSPCLAVAAAGSIDTTKLTAIANPTRSPTDDIPRWMEACASMRQSAPTLISPDRIAARYPSALVAGRMRPDAP